MVAFVHRPNASWILDFLSRSPAVAAVRQCPAWQRRSVPGSDELRVRYFGFRFRVYHAKARVPDSGLPVRRHPFGPVLSILLRTGTGAFGQGSFGPTETALTDRSEHGFCRIGRARMTIFLGIRGSRTAISASLSSARDICNCRFCCGSRRFRSPGALLVWHPALPTLWKHHRWSSSVGSITRGTPRLPVAVEQSALQAGEGSAQ